MQDRYAGDLGDFSKFGILKVLAGVGKSPRLRIGLVWYLTKPSDAERKKDDGKHTTYLQTGTPAARNFRECDARLYDALRPVAGSRQRSVAALEGAKVLPANTLYFSELLDYADLPRSGAKRLEWRDGWVDRALLATKRADLICLDPDNGLECKSVPRHRIGAPKYAFLEEVVLWGKRGQDLVIYQHANRKVPVERQAEDRARELAECLDRPVRTVLFRRGSVRMYLVAPSPERSELIFARMESLTAGPWADHVELLPPPKKG